jgi:LytR cell envelope-related transcriptional attenuator
VSARGQSFGHNGDMNRPSGGNGELMRGAGAAAMKGAALIGLAVIVGVFLLQRVDTSTAGSPTTHPKTPAKTTTTQRRQSQTTSTTATLPATPPKTPSQLNLIVLNGGAPTGAAAQMRTKLQQVGYTNQALANTWTGHSQTGKTVLCKAGLAREAVALSQQTALSGAKVVPFPTPAPPLSAAVDCVVVVGR